MPARYAELGLSDFWESLCREKPPADQIVDVLLLAVYLPRGRVLAPDETALPALKPNQPTQRSEAPIAEYTRLCGGMGCCGYPIRFAR